MQFRKRDFDGKRVPFPPLPAGHFFCQTCSTIRAESERSASGKRDHCKPCQTGAQAKSRASRAAKGLTKPRSTKTQSSRQGADQIPIDQNSVEPRHRGADQILIDQNSVEPRLTKSPSTKTQSSPG